MVKVERLLRIKFSLLLAILLFVVVAALHTYAQSAEGSWSTPVNLSNSGAASEPMLLAVGQAGWRVAWMDRFDGLVTTQQTEAGWEVPVARPLTVGITMANGDRRRLPVTEIPEVSTDNQGNLHVLWLEPTDSEITLAIASQAEIAAQSSGGQTSEPGPPQTTLYYTRTSEDGGWVEPRILAEAIIDWQLVEDAAGQLYLFYLRTGNDESAPSGLYYIRSTDGGYDWSDPQLINANIYLRLLDAGNTHLQVTTDGGTTLYVAWDDPHLQRSFYTRSTDGGTTWFEPESVGIAEERSKRLQVSTSTAGEVLRLWDATPVGTLDCILYQQRSTDGGATWSGPERVLGNLSICPPTWRFLRSAQGTIFWVGNEGGESVTIAAWNGTQWSAPKSLDLHFAEPVTGTPINLTSLQMALPGETLGVVGTGEEDGEVWFLESQISALEWAFAPLPSWSDPVGITSAVETEESSTSGDAGLAGLPAIAIQNDVFHLVWSESPSASQPSDTLQYSMESAETWTQPSPLRFVSLPEGNASEASRADEPALVAVGEQLHLVWSGGDGGQIFYSVSAADSVPVRWSEPHPISPGGVVACCSSLTADPQGVLHVVYAVPLNEGRGLYYTRSEDRGATWSPPLVIFDAAAEGWEMVTEPRVAVDTRGHIHVAWLRGVVPGTRFGSTDGIYYAHSTDGGENWSAPTQLMRGFYEWPLLLARGSGQVYVLGRESSGAMEWFSRRSDDGGIGWSTAEQVPGFAGVPGPVSLVTDGSEALYLLGLQQIGTKQSQLLMSTWDGTRWSPPETQGFTVNSQPGVAAALDATLGQIRVFFRRIVETEGGETATLRTTNRSVPLVAVTPVPTFTPQPTQTALPTVEPTATATPRPDVSALEPISPSGTLTAFSPLILSAVLATTIVGGIVVIRSARRS